MCSVSWRLLFGDQGFDWDGCHEGLRAQRAYLPPPLAGAPAVRQANGLPSGAQQLPLSVFEFRVKVHSLPEASDLHAAIASGGGPRLWSPSPPAALG